MTVVDGDPAIGLQRYAGWPGADGHVHVSIFTDVEPQALTQAIASRDTEAGLQTLAKLLVADRRLGRLLERHGVVREYVFDYGHGAVRVGAISDSGKVTLF